MKIRPLAISIVPIGEQSNDLLTRKYRVPPGLCLGSLSGSARSSLNRQRAPKERFLPRELAKDTQESTGGGWLLVNREGAKEFLASRRHSAVRDLAQTFFLKPADLLFEQWLTTLELVDAIVEQAYFPDRSRSRNRHQVRRDNAE